VSRGYFSTWGHALLVVAVVERFKQESMADLATERERQLKTARANQTAGLANGRAAN